MNANQFQSRFRACHQASELKELALVDVLAVRGTWSETVEAVKFAEDRLLDAADGGLDGMLLAVAGRKI